MAQKAVPMHPTGSPCYSSSHPVLWSRALFKQSLEHDTRWMFSGGQPPRMSKQDPLTYTCVTCLFWTVNISNTNSSVKLTFDIRQIDLRLCLVVSYCDLDAYSIAVIHLIISLS